MPLPKLFKHTFGSSPRQFASYASTLVAAGVGGALFAYAGMPAGWLSGALVLTAVLALAGVPVAVSPPIRTATYVVIGTSMGATITPDTLRGIATWPVTMAVLGLSVPVMIGASVLYLEKVSRWDRRSAFFASVPGALSTVLIMAESSGADTRRVVFGQSMRLFVLVALLPGVMGGLGHQPAGTLPVTPVVPDLAGFLMSLGVGILGGLVAERANFPGGSMVGAMLASGFVHGLGLIEGRLPDLLLIASFAVLGANTGSRFTGTRLETLRRFLVDSVVALVIATAVALGFALLGSWLADEPLPKVLLAYVPGALEAMTIMAFVLGVDPAFVAAHHLMRFLALAMLVPVIARLFFGRAVVPSEAVEIDKSEPKD
ncbi:AbrB family transcriptional regulator [Ancylobacter sp. MQZ15Z-1]|uniref:AbrB family transcriptional regulator n=1 Tax=Ancylobacter mangrovi TaxID=2972472 RepID=A0A9X2PG15_9HYPH|nr:AbrB family transcriptional regulator [Ancylobacter mangrovi]MCS0495498.1 AbrB family transcriptional regulator [Ancylobacter mangrovi]